MGGWKEVRKRKKSLICGVCQFRWCKYSHVVDFKLATNGLTTARATPEYLTDSCELVFLLNKQKTALENPQGRNSSALISAVQRVSGDPERGGLQQAGGEGWAGLTARCLQVRPRGTFLLGVAVSVSKEGCCCSASSLGTEQWAPCGKSTSCAVRLGPSRVSATDMLCDMLSVPSLCLSFCSVV